MPIYETSSPTSEVLEDLGGVVKAKAPEDIVHPFAGVQEFTEAATESNFFKDEALPTEKPIGMPTNVKYTTAPSHPAQLLTMPETVKTRKLFVKVFNTASDSDKYADLLNRTLPLEAPEVIIDSESKEFYEGSWLIMVNYRELLYQKL